MNYIDYVQLNPFQKFWYNLKKFFVNLPSNLVKIFCAIGRFFKRIGVGIGKGFAGYFTRFIKGDWATKLSYVIMGFGNIVRGQIAKGLLFLLTEAAFIYFMITFGWDKIYNLGFFSGGNIGFNAKGMWVDENGVDVKISHLRRVKYIEADDSMVLLLYGILTVVLIVLFFVVYIASTKSAYKAQQTKAAGEKLPTFKEDVRDLLDNKFHVTLLAFPTLTISIFTILPLIFMILIAFTNFDENHLFFGWTGLENFRSIFSSNGTAGSSEKVNTFVELTIWTLIWAVSATILNYILGMIVALLINKKGIKLKALWRTLFVVTVAVPQFVSLLLMSQMLDMNNGAINLLFQKLGIIENSVNFLGDVNMWIPRLTVIIVNIWVGIPYTILITSGILMNIPADLYESATIDGAGPVKSFFKITLPYMLFVTTPYLITSFIGNINNFNVIYLLCGVHEDLGLYHAGHTDLLVTWLFNLTTVNHDYKMAAAIGILVFIVCASVSLLTFNLTKSAKNEEEFS